MLTALVLTETTYAAVPPDSARPFRERRRAALLAQRAELTRLRWRTDSLLLGLGEAPASALAATDSLAPSYPQTLPPSKRWSVALAFAPERNYFALQSAVPTDTLTALRRTHETGRGGYNALVLAEYQVTSRLSVAAGLGISASGAEMRLTDRHTSIKATYDTTLTQTTRAFETTTMAYSVREDSVAQPNPIYNGIGQVTGFDTLWVPYPDTVRTTLHNVYSTVATTRTITPRLTKTEEVSTRILRPNYRFLTLPVLVRYRLTAPGGRWWADLAGGAQLQFFLGGTELSTRDGRTYQTERVKAGAGPFRPLNVALTAALGFNYALSPRLSASFSPTVRWQAVSTYKAATGLTQKPTTTGIQMGLRWQF